jgi:putative tricarboxylic transport membrane protein
LERLKKDPASLSLGTTAIGGSNHIPLFLVAKSVGADAKKVRTPVFKSSGEALTALLGGHVEMLISSVATVPPHVAAGSIRVLAVSSGKRAGGVLAQVPTWKELGVDCEFNAWRGLIGPKGLTTAQVAFWDDRLAKVVTSEKWKATVKKNLWVDEYMNSKELKAYLDRTDLQLRAALTDLGLAK